MYEVHPDNEGRWILYQTGDGGFDLVAWFADREDAEFAREAFAQRAARGAPTPGGRCRPQGGADQAAGRKQQPARLQGKARGRGDNQS